jgi:catechol 2,3-dioxygenase-like lactoylglutathione lyase family enzyme
MAQPEVQGYPVAVGESLPFHHVSYYARNIEEVGAFYERILGAASGDAQGFTFRLSEPNRYLFVGLARDDRAVGLDHVCFAVEDYNPDALKDSFRSLGLNVVEADRADQVFLRDPDGIRVQLASPNRPD